MTGLPYYNFDKLDTQAPRDKYVLYYILGGRRIGKTYALTKRVVEEYLKNGDKCIWLRNKAVETNDTPLSAQFCADGKNDGWIPEEFTAKKDGIYADVTGADCVVRFASVSTFSNMRGPAFPDYPTVCLDEMMPEDGRYPKGCKKVIPSFWRTVINGKQNGQMYVLSNFVFCANPYFASQRIVPKKGKDITIFPEKETAIEVCSGYRTHHVEGQRGEGMVKSFGYDDYITPDDPLETMISPVKGDRLYDYNVVTQGGIHSLYRDRDTNIYYWHTQKVGKNEPKCTLELSLVSKDIPMCTNGEVAAFKEHFRRGMMRFSTVNVMYDIVDMLT